MERVKIATHQCLFGQEKWIMKNIENCYPYVDMIYLSYSQFPWAYNPNARNHYKNSLDLELVKQSKYMDKIKIMYGDWGNEQEQRNACADEAQRDGMNYLIIQDTDEFYLDDDYIKLINFINNNQGHEIYRCNWISFWKTTEWVVVNRNLNDIVGLPQIAINLDKGIRFHDRRNPTGTNEITIPDIICYHMSFVLSDDECLTKLKTWGHAHEFNVDNWYRDIWLSWTPDKTNLHPIAGDAWFKTIRNNRQLPKELL